MCILSISTATSHQIPMFLPVAPSPPAKSKAAAPLQRLLGWDATHRGFPADATRPRFQGAELRTGRGGLCKDLQPEKTGLENMALMCDKNYWKQHETTKMIQVRKHPTIQKSSSTRESSHMGKNSIGFTLW